MSYHPVTSENGPGSAGNAPRPDTEEVPLDAAQTLCHEAALSGFAPIEGQTIKGDPATAREQLAPRFRNMTDEDLITSLALLQAVTRPAAAGQ